MPDTDGPSGVSGVLAAMSPGLGVRDGQLVVTSCLNGDTRMIGPRQVNARALIGITGQHGVAWTVKIDLDSASTRPPLTLRRNDLWVAPHTIASSGLSTEEAVVKWACSQPNLHVQHVPSDKVNVGAVREVVFRAKGDLLGTSVRNVLATVGVVNVWVTATGFRVWLARESETVGSLYHLSATSALTSNTRRRAVGKLTRRKRSRRARA